MKLSRFERARRILWGRYFRTSRRSSERDRRSLLKSLPIFNELSYWQIMSIEDYFYRREYGKNEEIFGIGYPGAALFIVEQGEVGIFVDGSRGRERIATLKKGDFFGEMALLDDEPRSATAMALSDVKVLALFRKDMNDIKHTKPEISSQIFRSLGQVIASRLRATNQLLGESDQEAS